MIYADENLVQLIICPKRISKPPRKEMKTDGKHLRDDMELESLDGEHIYRVFMRQSLEFSENFSIGLDYVPRDERKSFCLIRYNGMHGSNSSHQHHLRFHIHRCRAKDVNAGLRDASHVEVTEKYAAFRDALSHFIREVKIPDADLPERFSSHVRQKLLFERKTAP